MCQWVPSVGVCVSLSLSLSRSLLVGASVSIHLCGSACVCVCVCVCVCADGRADRGAACGASALGGVGSHPEQRCGRECCCPSQSELCVAAASRQCASGGRFARHHSCLTLWGGCGPRGRVVWCGVHSLCPASCAGLARTRAWVSTHTDKHTPSRALMHTGSHTELGYIHMHKCGSHCVWGCGGVHRCIFGGGSTLQCASHGSAEDTSSTSVV